MSVQYTIEDVKTYPLWRHVQTNSLYHIMGIAMCSTNGEREHKEVSVVYFSIDYQGLRYREINEFLDGRFEPVTTNKPNQTNHK